MKRPRFRALVLAAGLGTRLRPLTEFFPKPLVPVMGKPLLAHTLEVLAGAGCEKTAINLHYQGEKIVSRFGDTFQGMGLEYSSEKEILGTLGALSQLGEFFEGVDLAVVVNGDSLCRWPIRMIVRRHQRSRARVTLLAASRAEPGEFGGGIGLDRAGRVRSFAPGRDFGEVEKRTVFAGLHVFSPRLIEGLQVRRAGFVPDLYEPMLMTEERIEAVETGRSWFDLGTPASFLAGVCEVAQRRGLLKIPGSNWIASDAVVSRGVSLRSSVLESESSVGDKARLERSIVLPGASVGAGCRLRDCLVGPGVELPSGTAVEGRLVTVVRSDQPPAQRDSVVGGLVYSPIFETARNPT